MSSPPDFAKLVANLPQPMKGQPRLVVICGSWPEQMSKPLRDALKYLFETHASEVTGVVGGNLLKRQTEGRYKGYIELVRPVCEVMFHMTELDGYLIHNVLHAWGREAQKFSPRPDDTVPHRLGPDMYFFEPNADFSKPLRVWHGYDMLPEDTGLFSAHRGDVSDAPSEATRQFRIRFKQELNYNYPEDIQHVTTLMNLHREELTAKGDV